MKTFVLYLLSIVLAALFFYACYLIKSFFQKMALYNIFEKVSRVVVQGWASTLRNTEKSQKIAPSYVIKDNEDTAVAEILTAHKQHLIDLLMNKSLSTKRDFRILSDEEYFMLSLCSFLDKNKYNIMNWGHDMRVFKLETDHAKEYTLTDFGVAYYKLLYISAQYCKNNKKINPSGNLYSFNGLDTNITTKTVKFFK